MGTFSFWLLVADASSVVGRTANLAEGIPDPAVLEYLKYGTLGLAGIILFLASLMYLQANLKTNVPQMQAAQAGVADYMKVAKWLLIPCMGLQILSIVLNTQLVDRLFPTPQVVVQPPVTPPPVQILKPVNATICIPPLKKDDPRYGGAAIKIFDQNKQTWTTPSPGSIDNLSIKVDEHDIIMVNIDDVVRQVDIARQSSLPTPTKDSQATLLK